MKLLTPASIKAEREELQIALIKATQAGGRTGQVAGELARLLRPHFSREEEYALPPLGLLESLAAGEVTPDMERVLLMTERLKEELPDIMAEHEQLVDALYKLSDAAKEEDLYEYAVFAERVILHLQHEEDVLYPAAILAGEYVRLALRGPVLSPLLATW